MFTFGRQHEKECAVRYLKNPDQVNLIHHVIDVVHDLLENSATLDVVRPVFATAFEDGGSGVWEQTGSWILKLDNRFPQTDSLWREFANHPNWKVRFRAACFIGEMPSAIAMEIGAKLQADQSKKVREMATARIQETNESGRTNG